MDYIPLTMTNPIPKHSKAVDFELRMHIGGACVDEKDEWSEKPLPER